MAEHLAMPAADWLQVKEGPAALASHEIGNRKGAHKLNRAGGTRKRGSGWRVLLS